MYPVNGHSELAGPAHAAALPDGSATDNWSESYEFGHNLVQIFLAADIVLSCGGVPAAGEDGIGRHPVVVIETSAGTITASYILTRREDRGEFSRLRENEYYSGTIFHRVSRIHGPGRRMTANLRRKRRRSRCHKRGNQRPIKPEGHAGDGAHLGYTSAPPSSSSHRRQRAARHRGETGTPTAMACSQGDRRHGRVDKIEGTPTNTVDATANVPVQAITIKAIR